MKETLTTAAMLDAMFQLPSNEASGTAALRGRSAAPAVGRENGRLVRSGAGVWGGEGWGEGVSAFNRI